MAELSDNQRSFIAVMKKSVEHARRGFQLLQQRPASERFFDELAAQGLFDPSENPAAVPTEPEGSVRVPYWDALSYLTECARRSGERDDRVLAEKVIGVVRKVSRPQMSGGVVTDNFHTFREFAVILGLLPVAVITTDDIDLVPTWLGSRFDRDGVAHALGAGAIARFLASEAPTSWAMATRLLSHLLVWKWQSTEFGETTLTDPASLVDSNELHELLARHAGAFGRRDGHGAATVLQRTVGEIFSEAGRSELSFIFRPAVEDHAQNNASRSVENCVVDGLRDVLLAWSEVDPIGSKSFVADLMRSPCEMIRRIGIFVLSERWEVHKGIYRDQIAKELFSTGHLHELFGLLKKHFEQMDLATKASTMRALRSRVQDADEASLDSERSLECRYLEALSGSGFELVTERIAELRAHEELLQFDHPDFFSYSESSWGFGRAPFSSPDLVGLAAQGRLAEAINGFVPSGQWRGPTTEGLQQELEKAATASPEAVLGVLITLRSVSSRFQNAALRGLKAAWEASTKNQSDVAWDTAWEQIISFQELVLSDSAARSSAEPNEPEEFQWLLCTMSDLLRAGTRNDDHAYPPSQLHRGWSVLTEIAARARRTDAVPEDPMGYAINSSEGRTLEACIEHVLRECRLADQKHGSHAMAWSERESFFESELAAVGEISYTFATLVGAYFANLEYLSPDWLAHCVPKVFSDESSELLACAIGGLAYGQMTKSTYVLLRDADALDRAFANERLRGNARPRLVERVLLGHMWELDELDSTRVMALFGSHNADDLETAIWFLWMLRKQELNKAQQKRVVAFWEKCILWAIDQPTPPRTVLARLSRLTCYLEDARGRNGELLSKIAPYVGANHVTHEFVSELLRMVKSSPTEVRIVVERMLESTEPAYDYEGRLVALVASLAELGERTAALNFCHKLRNLPGIHELYKHLVAAAPDSGRRESDSDVPSAS